MDVLATDHALRGVAVPAVEHLVELRNEPRTLTLGMMISSVSLIAMLAVFIWAGVS